MRAFWETCKTSLKRLLVKFEREGGGVVIYVINILNLHNRTITKNIKFYQITLVYEYLITLRWWKIYHNIAISMYKCKKNNQLINKISWIIFCSDTNYVEYWMRNKIKEKRERTQDFYSASLFFKSYIKFSLQTC